MRERVTMEHDNEDEKHTPVDEEDIAILKTYVRNFFIPTSSTHRSS